MKNFGMCGSKLLGYSEIFQNIQIRTIPEFQPLLSATLKTGSNTGLQLGSCRYSAILRSSKSLEAISSGNCDKSDDRPSLVSQELNLKSIKEYYKMYRFNMYFY
jgi:hypothetical protein